MGEAIVVTAMGAVTPMGLGVQAFWNGLLEERCAVGPITRFDPAGLAVRIAAQVPDVELGLSGKQLRESAAFTQYALAAAAEALQGGLPADADRVGIVMGTAMAGIATTAARMVSIILHDEKAIMPASMELCGEYGESGLFAGVPCLIGANGVEKVIELPLTDEEMREFHACCDGIRKNMEHLSEI